MRRVAITLLAILTAGCATTPRQQTPIQRQTDAMTADETRRVIEELRAAIAADPSDGARVYTLAQYLDRAGDTAESLQWLRELVRIGWTRGVNDHDFRHTIAASSREYRSIAATLNLREPPVIRSSTAFTLGERDLIPEGIAFDSSSGDFYVSSIHLRKIVRITPDGRSSDFISSGQDGIFSTLGMKVDPVRHILWVATAATREMQGFQDYMTGQSGVFAYDLRNGALVTKVLTGTATDASLLNDLIVLDDGSALITDTESGAVLRVRFGSDSIESWLPDGTFLLPNGIAAIPGEPYVYVASFPGIARVDIRSRTVAALTGPAGETLGGIDGLVTYDGSLVGIQNTFGKPRVLRATLDADRLAIRAVETLESGNPLFDEPTTCAVAGTELYYFANPQLRAYDESYGIWPRERLREILVLRLPLG